MPFPVPPPDYTVLYICIGLSSSITFAIVASLATRCYIHKLREENFGQPTKNKKYESVQKNELAAGVTEGDGGVPQEQEI